MITAICATLGFMSFFNFLLAVMSKTADPFGRFINLSAGAWMGLASYWLFATYL